MPSHSTRYRYEPVSGKVAERWLLAGPRKLMGERYGYDSDGRLTSLETSTDSLYWEQEAAQSYYATANIAASDQILQAVYYKEADFLPVNTNHS